MQLPAGWPAIGLIVVLTIVLVVTVRYSALRARYADIYLTYNALLSVPGNQAIPVNIGPRRIMFGYEYPDLSSVVMSRPITQPAAEFLLKLIRTIGVPAGYLLAGPDNRLQNLAAAVASRDAWNSLQNPLGPGPASVAGPNGYGKIPYDAMIVQQYNTKTETAGKSRDLSLEVLWLYGYEEYVRQRFTSGATSVLDEWNYMFGSVAQAPATDKDSSCSSTAQASKYASSIFSLGGMGAMFGPVGAVVGAGVGAFEAWTSTSNCRQ